LNRCVGDILAKILGMMKRARLLALPLIVGLNGCGGTAQLPVREGMGSSPKLPPPEKTIIPVMGVAPAVGWKADETPVAALGLTANRFADSLSHPRWLYVLPNGDVLVAETNGPGLKEDAPKGIRGYFFKRLKKKAGGLVPSANRITLLRDANGDGVADTRTVLIDSLYSPFGMVLVDSTLYIANTDALVMVPYHVGDTHITVKPTKVLDLPGRPFNHHWTKSLIASPDGSKLYVGVGSNSNAAERGIEAEEGRAAIWEIDRKTGAHRVYASGLRNPVGMTWEPTTGMLWVAVNERDELGSDLVPDYMTSVRDGGFYGWPYSYYGTHVDKRVKPRRPDLVAKAIVPDYALGPHTASLGLTWSDGATLPAPFSSGMFVGQHGSWNRQPLSGYRVIFVPFANGQPSGAAIDVLTGFLKNDHARGRPVGVVIDKKGALLVADDVGNVIWRVTGASATAH
jgi:glucose/arabinose dehydrogenase